MSTLSGLISAGGGGALPQIALTQSQTFVPPQDGNICIHVIGAGAGANGGSNYGASGGAGGYCKKNSLAVTTSGSFTVVVGVGGSGNDGNSNGAAGGNSTVAGTGLSATLTANGGAATSNNTGGGGGTASNGDVNNTGGAGSNGGADGGGGAVGVYGTGEAGAGNQPYEAGSSDAMGPASFSGFGQIVGDRGGLGSGANEGTSAGSYPFPSRIDGGFLSGGGCANIGTVGSASDFLMGGCSVIGGGGGGCRSNVNNSIGGHGGDGIVLIQYLPS